MDLNIDEGAFLVRLAREAIRTYLKTRKKIDPPVDTPAKLREKCGVFVTLNSVEDGHELRGCIGYPLPLEPLVKATIDSAIEAATGDPRFEPVSLVELERKIVLDVSVLTPPESIVVDDPKGYPRHIVIGRDGLIVERGWHKGLLLPQVAIEWGWNEEEFLSNCCLKAGLAPDAWLVKGTNVQRFQAIVFQEASPAGEVSLKDLGGSKAG